MNFGSNISLTKDILNYSNAKNNVISNNLSNISNPQYKRQYLKDLSFKEEMDISMKATREGHIKETNNTDFTKAYTDTSKGRNDENNVNLDTEIINLTSNKYLFEISSSILQKEYTKLREAII